MKLGQLTRAAFALAPAARFFGVKGGGFTQPTAKLPAFQSPHLFRLME